MVKNVTIDRDVSIKTNFKYNITENEVIGYLKNPKLILQSKYSNDTPAPETGILILPNNFYKPLKQNCNIHISFDVELKPNAAEVIVPSHVEFSCLINKANSNDIYENYIITIPTVSPGSLDDQFGFLVTTQDLVTLKNLNIRYEGFLIESLKPISTTVQFDGIVGVDRLVIEEIQ